MRSRTRLRANCAAAAAAVLAIGMLLIGDAEAAQAPEQGTAPTAEQVKSALTELQADQALGAERKTRTLRWKDVRKPTPPPTGLMQWIADLMSWIAGSARILIWVVISILAAMLVVILIRQLREVELPAGRRRADAPTHVRDLDIRPESLPDDIGAAALALWENGEQRAALSLLYRGLLSRLVHAYGVPIRQSSTEGDCLQLAERHLQQNAVVYAGRLVRTWQRAVYGGKQAATEEVRELCRDFGVALRSALVEQRA